ncbi:MAG TPA: SpoIVB peptidase [Candidatus Flavonifractor merdigallinarum]|uniref:SpoIVB peptidase n=1 Tax=Candidatus Flavonifractor merdigallinarum TaxID=2838589 RepID=A0A9D1YA92_9FIRM|nr:SpoIVB peptidase [Candidatus Flavonifractor merdigallinarum]
MREESNTKPGRFWLLRLTALGLTLAALVWGAWPVRAAAPEDTPVAGVGDTVVPLGRAVGIKLFADGVMVVGLGEVDTAQGAAAPAKSCGLRAGDIITHINSEEVDTIEEVQSILQDLEGETMSIRARRDGEELQVTAQAVQCATDGSYKLGAWIRDSMAGIGTLTFYDPKSGVFGALGHGISDVDTQELMPLQSGSIMFATVQDVRRGEQGAPGELHGAFEVNRDLGELSCNSTEGIFGTLTDTSLTQGMEEMTVAGRSEVHTGPAVIHSNIAGDKVQEFEVEITRVYPADSASGRDLTLKVTDEALLNATGGIVQGMSGSPIIQDGKLVGAVTHVLVNDPTQGYGILMETMLETCKNG